MKWHQSFIPFTQTRKIRSKNCFASPTMSATFTSDKECTNTLSAPSGIMSISLNPASSTLLCMTRIDSPFNKVSTKPLLAHFMSSLHGLYRLTNFLTTVCMSVLMFLSLFPNPTSSTFPPPPSPSSPFSTPLIPLSSLPPTPSSPSPPPSSSHSHPSLFFLP